MWVDEEIEKTPLIKTSFSADYTRVKTREV